MKFFNHTTLQSRLFTGALSEHVNGGWVVGRATYALPAVEGGDLVPIAEQWPVFGEPLETEFGVFPGDDYPFRPQAEVVVVARARARRPVRHLDLRLSVGAFSTRLMVFGNRRWTPRGTELVPGEAEPFVELDLGLENAFGGITIYEGMEFPHPLNPQGKGFYLSAEQAAGRPMANVERPDCLVERWSDQPMIATWAPVTNSPAWQMAEWIGKRTRASKKPIDEKELAAQSRSVHPSAAPPSLLLDEIQPGDPVSVDLGAERLGFRVPAVTTSVRTQIGSRRSERSLRIHGLWILARKRLVVVSWIARFKYGLRPGERRSASLELAQPIT